jgi:hypothetical protein
MGLGEEGVFQHKPKKEEERTRITSIIYER